MGVLRAGCFGLIVPHSGPKWPRFGLIGRFEVPIGKESGSAYHCGIRILFGTLGCCATCCTICILAFAYSSLLYVLCGNSGNRGLSVRAFVVFRRCSSLPEVGSRWCHGVIRILRSVLSAAVVGESSQYVAPWSRAVAPVETVVLEFLFPVTRSRLPLRFVFRH